MRIHRIIEHTRAEGPGTRLAVWAQGCKSACAGCYARELWDMSGGIEMSADELTGARTVDSDFTAEYRETEERLELENETEVRA